MQVFVFDRQYHQVHFKSNIQISSYLVVFFSTKFNSSNKYSAIMYHGDNYKRFSSLPPVVVENN